MPHLLPSPLAHPRRTWSPPMALLLIALLLASQTGCRLQTVRSETRGPRGWASAVVRVLPPLPSGFIATGTPTSEIGQGAPATEDVPDLTVAGGGATAHPEAGRSASAASGLAWLQEAVERAGRAVLGMRPFPYAAATQGGSLGCAQVVSALLRKAGLMDGIELGVLGVLARLRGSGWRNVRPPPYRSGDVITWATYDRTGDGKIDPDTHVGVVVVEGGTKYVIANSSTNRRPEKHPLSYYHYPVSHVVRMPGA